MRKRRLFSHARRGDGWSILLNEGPFFWSCFTLKPCAEGWEVWHLGNVRLMTLPSLLKAVWYCRYVSCGKGKHRW